MLNASLLWCGVPLGLPGGAVPARAPGARTTTFRRVAVSASQPGRKPDTNVEDAAKDVTSQLCRLRVLVKDRSVELALPTDVALVDMLPAILQHAGPELADEGVEHEGWVLQRFGKAPLDENRTATELGLLDGETVHLRPRAASLPEIDFDDLVDGIAEQVRRRSDAWTNALSRWMLLAFAGLSLVLGLLVLTMDGSTFVRTIASGATGLALLVAATAIARSTADTMTATVLALLAVPYAALCGWLLPLAVQAGAGIDLNVTCAAVLVVVALAAGLLGTADSALLFVSALFAAVLGAVTALINTTTPADTGQAAAIGLVLCLITLGFVPTSAFRLAGLSLPMLPTTADEFTEDTDPIPHQIVVQRSAVANRYMTGLYLTLGALQVVLFAIVVHTGAMWEMIMVAVAGLLLLLRSRHIDGARQRWALLVPAGFGLSADALRLVAGFDPFNRFWFAFACALLLALLLVVASKTLPGRKLRPYWGRAVDILETLSALAIIPLLLAVLDVYMLVRGLAG
ncbi:type VII secretion integral membrane protein EccD [Saccharopolyspora sp. K220]|uniref:type VII secretion integral membrane protein EccD n=1 Tax=Saccharopolyspora soli TaxID=2926618 RepID=UPI001F5A1910|nr:type VII secretion integral membrane protein EccD [Saccharopolyspora soli]MCI2417477.1 type VII secretion integral membrane protein EccD [Saccharopolyspora soli]